MKLYQTLIASFSAVLIVFVDADETAQDKKKRLFRGSGKNKVALDAVVDVENLSSEFNSATVLALYENEHLGVFDTINKVSTDLAAVPNNRPELSDQSTQVVLKELTYALVKKIPVVGCIAGFLVEVLWTIPEVSVWDQIYDQLKNMIETYITNLEWEDIQERIGYLKYDMGVFEGETDLLSKGVHMNDLIQELHDFGVNLWLDKEAIERHVDPDLRKQKNFILVDYAATFMEVHLNILKERYLYGSFMGAINGNLASWKLDLEEYANKYQDYIDWVRGGAWEEWRNGKFTKTHEIDNEGLVWYCTSDVKDELGEYKDWHFKEVIPYDDPLCKGVAAQENLDAKLGEAVAAMESKLEPNIKDAALFGLPTSSELCTYGEAFVQGSCRSLTECADGNSCSSGERCIGGLCTRSTIMYNDALALSKTSYGTTSNCGLYGCRVLTVPLGTNTQAIQLSHGGNNGGLSPFSRVYIRSKTKSENDCVKYGDEVFLSLANLNGSNQCGKWGCRVFQQDGSSGYAKFGHGSSADRLLLQHPDNSSLDTCIESGKPVVLYCRSNLDLPLREQNQSIRIIASSHPPTTFYLHPWF